MFWDRLRAVLFLMIGYPMANMTSSAPATVISAELASAQIDELAALIERYRDDPRQQVKKACERAARRLEKERRERERVRKMYEQMLEMGGDGVVVGVDEVGRGSVAGSAYRMRRMPSC